VIGVSAIWYLGGVHTYLSLILEASKGGRVPIVIVKSLLLSFGLVPGVQKFESNCKQNGFSAEVRAPVQGKRKPQWSRECNTDYVQLQNPDLLHNQSCIGGEWKDAKSGKTFEVVGWCHSSLLRS
jgi:hypothetical protein